MVVKVTVAVGLTLGAVTANGKAVTAASGIYTPADDPGATAEYTVTAVVTFAANDTLSAVTRAVTMTDGTDTAKTASVNVVQGAAPSRVSVNPASLTFATAGEGKTFQIFSNDSWTVS